MNELTQQGIAYFEAGDEAKALECFVESLRHNDRDVETWFWLAMTLDSHAERERCMHQVLRADPVNEIARKGLVYLADDIQTLGERPGDTHRSVAIPVAGVDYKKRQSAVKNLRVNEQVFLRREPFNPYDPFAIRVETSLSEHIGYIPKEVALVLAPYLDDVAKLLSARVVALQTGAQEEQPVSVKIAFHVPNHLQLPAYSHEQIEYFYDNSGTHAYILLNCTKVDLNTIKSELQKDGMKVQKTGVGSRMASNGRYYQWFIRVEPQEQVDTHQWVSQFFERTFGILSNEARIKKLEADRQALQEALSQAQQARDQLKKEKDALFETSLDYVKSTDRLRTEVIESEQKIRRKDAEIVILNLELARRDSELDNVQGLLGMLHGSSPSEEREALREIFAQFLPNVDFLRDTLNVLLHEVQDREEAIHLLQQIASDPYSFKNQSTESLEGFWAYPLDSSHQIFFRSEDDTIHVLIPSRKRS